MGQVCKRHDRRVDDGHQHLHHPVAAAVGDAGVKRNVLGDMVLPGQIGVLDLVAQAAQPLLFLGGGVVCGRRRDLRLQRNAHVEQLEGQLVFIIQLGKPQRVLRAAAVAFDVGAVAAAHFQNALGDQAFDGFPDRAAPHLEHLSQLKLIGQFFPDLHRGIENIGHQVVFDLRPQQLAFHAIVFHPSLNIGSVC